MELLEREGPLAALSEARNIAGDGRGSVVMVSGEPGIGKTALVSRFADDLGDGARVLWGICDDLNIPRPLGPFRDLTGASGALMAALSSETPSHQFHRILFEELEMAPRPTVLIMEDVHWADEATIDAITVIGRRIAQVPALVIVTFRRGELDPGHPLHSALGAIRGGTSLYLDLAPLSRAAVTSLSGEDSDRVYAATGGNPFYVTEMLAALRTELPESVANAVLGRASRLDEPSRRLVELVSMVPSRVPSRVLDLVMHDWAAAAEEPERQQLLHIDPRHVRFRHELARAAIRSSVPIARRRRLHAEVLEALLATGADPAEIVHHAEGAGNLDVVAEYALVAARRAAAVDSNREAYMHYSRAADFADRLPTEKRAELMEELAVTAYTVDRMPEALSAITMAIEANEEIADLVAVGRCTRVLSRCHWYVGDGEVAKQEANRAVEILEPLGDSVELARAYSSLSQLAMLAGNTDEAMQWGERAVGLAEKLDAWSVKAHALINIGSVRMESDPSDFDMLLEAHRLADATGDRHEAVRALLNLGYTAFAWLQPDVAERYIDAAIDYAEEHQVDALGLYSRMTAAWLQVRRGDWAEAEGWATGVALTETGVNQLLAKTVLTELAVRRGDPDAGDRLADLADQAERTGELQRIGPVLQLETEWAMTTGAELPLERFASSRPSMRTAVGWAESLVAAWAAVAGIDMAVTTRVPTPHAAMLQRDWKRAADEFGAIGWEYDHAFMLSLLEDEPALSEALAVARRIGAGPLEERVAQRMKQGGMTVPARPRETTLANPAGLTSRQLDVLELIVEGLSNQQIADRLYLSVRTVEHHVEAILTKLGAANRRDAAHRFAELSTDHRDRIGLMRG